jgi:hypothetical protein
VEPEHAYTIAKHAVTGVIGQAPLESGSYWHPV